MSWVNCVMNFFCQFDADEVVEHDRSLDVSEEQGMCEGFPHLYGVPLRTKL